MFRRKTLAEPILLASFLIVLISLPAVGEPVEKSEEQATSKESSEMETQQRKGRTWEFAVRPLAAVDEVYPLVSKYKDDAVAVDTSKWEGTKVLSIGNSFVSTRIAGVMLRHMMLAGADIRFENRQNANLKSWTEDGRIQRLIKRHGPDVIVVALDVDPKNYRRIARFYKYVSKIVDAIEPITCYWIGPMALIHDKTGFNQSFSERVKPCKYQDPRVLEMKEPASGKSYSKKTTDRWAEQLWRQLSLNP